MSVKKKLNVRFIGKNWNKLPAGKVPHPFTEFLKDYEIVTTETPDYVISKESQNFYATCMERFSSAPIRILFAGEAFVPDFNIFDYAISFDRLDFGDRSFRLNTMNFFSFDKTYGELLKNEESISDMLSHGDKEFCNFIYSSGISHPMRRDFFAKLAPYKHVDSLGKLLKNSDKVVPGGADWRQSKVDFQGGYKFTAAIENSHYRGYTTEKLLHPMAAGSIPIYWGNSDVGLEFNTRSFVNCHDYANLDEVVERVKELDQDDSKFEELVREPWMTEQQRKDYLQNGEDLKEFLTNIFEQDISDARRRGEGTWVWRYEETLKERVSLHEKRLNNFPSRLRKRLEKWRVIKSERGKAVG